MDFPFKLISISKENGEDISYDIFNNSLEFSLKDGSKWSTISNIFQKENCEYIAIKFKLFKDDFIESINKYFGYNLTDSELIILQDIESKYPFIVGYRKTNL